MITNGNNPSPQKGPQKRGRPPKYLFSMMEPGDVITFRDFPLKAGAHAHSVEKAAWIFGKRKGWKFSVHWSSEAPDYFPGCLVVKRVL